MYGVTVYNYILKCPRVCTNVGSTDIFQSLNLEIRPINFLSKDPVSTFSVEFRSPKWFDL